MSSSHSELLEALKLAFCHMPENVFLTQREYAENLPKIKEEVNIVRNILMANGVDPDKLYNEMNPVLAKPIHSNSNVKATVGEGIALQASKLEHTEVGVLFDRDNVDTYPPEFTFVVINILENVPVYYDRKKNTWWTAIAEKGSVDIFARDELYYVDMSEEKIYWQPISFTKAQTLFIPAK